MIIFLTTVFFSFVANAQVIEQNKKPQPDYGRPKQRTTTAAGILKKKDVQRIKMSKIIVAQYGQKEHDDAIFEIVKKFWTFTTDLDTMPYNKAIELARKDDRVLVLCHTSTNSVAYNMGIINEDHKFIVPGRLVLLEDGAQKTVMLGDLPSMGGKNLLTREAFSACISAMNTNLLVMDKYQMKNYIRIRSKILENAGDRIKNRTLLIPKELLSDKIDEATISALYPGKFKIVSYEKYRNAIVDKEKGKAYVFFAPTLADGKIVYIQYIIDAEDGLVLGLYIPGAVSMEVPFPFSDANLSRGNRCEINESSLKGYKEIYEAE